MLKLDNIDIPMVVVCFLLMVGGVLPFVLRRHLWLRGLCVSLILFATLFGFGRFWVSGRMAMKRLAAEHKEGNVSDGDASFYTWRAASTALPIFGLAILSLSFMALIPPDRPESDKRI